MLILLALFIIYILSSIYFYGKNRTKYEYRSSNILEKVADLLLIPLMELIATGKDSHWWDYEFIDIKNIDVKALIIDTGKPQKRLFKKSKLFGQYNLSGIHDLYLTLRVLNELAVVEPVNYGGEWSLVIKGQHKFEDNDETLIACKFTTKGKVQTLLDGKRSYYGLTKDNKFIEIKLVEICDRNKHKDILFV
ncbi:MAG: hypothetical protein ABI721_01700 [Candidatus Dojkabacteria bacterium]